jgi:hypothetical protein
LIGPGGSGIGSVIGGVVVGGVDGWDVVGFLVDSAGRVGRVVLGFGVREGRGVARAEPRVASAVRGPIRPGIGVVRRGRASFISTVRGAPVTVGVGVGVTRIRCASLSSPLSPGRAGSGSTAFELTGPPARLTLTRPPYSMQRPPNA